MGDVDLGGPELVIILVVAVLLFGGAKIPELARSVGRARREFDAGLKGEPDRPSSSKKDEPRTDPSDGEAGESGDVDIVSE
jgi:sec-independent protein translocase protein TatA